MEKWGSQCKGNGREREEDVIVSGSGDRCESVTSWERRWISWVVCLVLVLICLWKYI